MGALPDAARACLVEAKSLVACPGCTLSSVGMHTAGSVLISSQTARAVLLLVRVASVHACPRKLHGQRTRRLR